MLEQSYKEIHLSLIKILSILKVNRDEGMDTPPKMKEYTKLLLEYIWNQWKKDTFPDGDGNMYVYIGNMELGNLEYNGYKDMVTLLTGKIIEDSNETKPRLDYHLSKAFLEEIPQSITELIEKLRILKE